MKYDKSKVKTGTPYPVKDRYLVFANGALRIMTDGITSFQDISPYNSTSGSEIPHAYDGHTGVDVRAAVGTPVYAEKDLKVSYGHDDYGNKVVCNGFRMRHMDDLPTKTSFKKGEIVFYTGIDNTSAPHLHIGREDGGDTFATFTEGKPSTSKSYRYCFEVIDDFADTVRYYPGVAPYKLKCIVSTHVYNEPTLKSYASDWPLKVGEKVISRYHSKFMKDGKEYHVHEISKNQYGCTCYFLYKNEK